MATVTLTQALKEPLNFLYLFVTNDFLLQLNENKAKIIYNKRANQTQYLHNILKQTYGTEYTGLDENGKSKFFANVRDNQFAPAIKAAYGLTPQVILYKLSIGENVVGKDWDSGVYGVSGIGATNQNNYTQDKNTTVDTQTGKILKNGTELPNQTPIYKADKKGNAYIAGYTATDGDGENAKQYTSGIDETTFKKTGTKLYYASTYSTTSLQQFANGTEYSSSKASSIWQSISTFIPYIMQCLTWIKSIIAELKGFTKENTTMNQKEWIEDEPNTSKLSKLALIAAVGLGVYYLASDDKKKSPQA